MSGFGIRGCACVTLLIVVMGCKGSRQDPPIATNVAADRDAAGGVVWHRLPDVKRQLEEIVHHRLSTGTLMRSNGYVYAIDLSQLLAYAALREQEAWFKLLQAESLKAVVTRKVQGGEPATFVAWRHKPSPDAQELEASGTTEALELARALWLGADTFNRPGDQKLAVQLMHGYAQHQHIEEGVWLVRNYYNLQDDAFADNSYLVDYDPDFVAFVAKKTKSATLCDVALRSQRLVQDAVTPSGLIHAVVNPGMLTMMPFALYSPNNIEKLANVAAVAERASESNAAQARAILAFAVSQDFDLRLYYDARTGQPHGEDHAGVATYATLARLAAKLGDHAANERFLAKVLQKVPEISQEHDEDVMYLLGQALLALEFARRLRHQEPLPDAYHAGADDCIALR